MRSARRRRRETCICEIPTRAAISDCVSPSKNRSSTIAPLARVERREAGLDEHTVSSTSSYPASGLAEDVLHRLLVAAVVAERLRERAGGVGVVRLESLDDLVLVDPDRLGELGDRRRPARGRRSCVSIVRVSRRLSSFIRRGTCSAQARSRKWRWISPDDGRAPRRS